MAVRCLWNINVHCCSWWVKTRFFSPAMTNCLWIFEVLKIAIFLVISFTYPWMSYLLVISIFTPLKIVYMRCHLIQRGHSLDCPSAGGLLHCKFIMRLVFKLSSITYVIHPSVSHRSFLVTQWRNFLSSQKRHLAIFKLHHLAWTNHKLYNL